MQTVPNPLLQQYIKLTEFLGLALGPDYEVVLHDLTNKDHSIIAIANSHISGRKLGAPLTNMSLSILRDKSYEHTDYHLHYYSNSADAVALDAINRELERMGVTPEQLTPEKRLQVIAALESGGLFLLKGAVKSAAASLHCSPASVYRYITQIKNSDNGQI